IIGLVWSHSFKFVVKGALLGIQLGHFGGNLLSLAMPEIIVITGNRLASPLVALIVLPFQVFELPIDVVQLVLDPPAVGLHLALCAVMSVFGRPHRPPSSLAPAIHSRILRPACIMAAVRTDIGRFPPRTVTGLEFDSSRRVPVVAD